MKKIVNLIVLISLVFSGFSLASQNGGKAEPNRIKFAKGKSLTTVKGRLKGDEEHEFVFKVRAGQKVYVTNSDSENFSYSIVSANDSNFFYDSKDLAEPTLEFKSKESGDYYLIVKRTAQSKTAKKFAITLAVK